MTPHSVKWSLNTYIIIRLTLVLFLLSLSFFVFLCLSFFSFSSFFYLLSSSSCSHTGTNFTKRYLPRLGELTFVTLCNVCLSFTLLLRSCAKTSFKTSKLLFLASLLPMIGGDQCYVVVDSAVIQRGAACGLGKGEMSAMLDNVTALVYIFASAMWSRLFKRDPILPLQVAASICLISTVPYSLGMRAAKIEDEESEKKRRN